MQTEMSKPTSHVCAFYSDPTLRAMHHCFLCMSIDPTCGHICMPRCSAPSAIRHTARHALTAKSLTLLIGIHKMRFLQRRTFTFFVFYRKYRFSKIRNYHGRESTKKQFPPYPNVKFIDNTPFEITEMRHHFLQFRRFFDAPVASSLLCSM